MKMRKWILNIISFLAKKEKPIQPSNTSNKVFGFESLTPTSNADESGFYCAALDEALNQSNHNNIALTGGYGTGKSSVVETYLSKSIQYTNQNVIRISLANFNFRKPVDNEKKRRPFIAGRNTNDNEEQIVLEISVLQQIIFQIQKKSVSRGFRKKIKQNYIRPFLYSLLILVTFISSILFWCPTLLYKWFDMNNLYQLIESKWFIAFTFLLSFGGSLVLIALLMHRLFELRLSKFEIKSVGVNFDKKELDFSLNSHLDELIYLLKHGRINLIVFEDLDRFNDHEIFEKLREINHILRYTSDLRDKKIKFLYVVRESIFKTENEKNKFFDIIIPVVPFISTKNAQSKMLKLFSDEIRSIAKGKLRNQFESVIKTAALCIDEMRTIKSIYNDYLIYLKVVERNDKNTIYIPKHEVLAIVIYKNIFPLDFEEINSGTSMLELILNKRSEFLNELIESKKDEIKTLKVKLDNIQGELITTNKELRMQYINSFFNTLPINQGIQIRGIQNISNICLEELSSDKNFELIMTNGIRIGHTQYSFEQIEEVNKNNLTYKERNEIIHQRSNGQESELLDKIKSIENEIKSLRNLSFANIIRQSKKIDDLKVLLKELLTDKHLKDEELKDNEHKGYSKFDFKIDLVVSLIIDGHINLNYRHYTSIFHDGDLSFNDRALYMKFKTGEVFDFEQHFDKPISFLEQFTPTDWNNLTFFCEELFDEILYTQKYNEQLDLFFSKGNEYCLKFLNFYIPRIPESNDDPKSSFFKKLSKHIFPNWKNFTEQALNSDVFDNSNYDLLLPQLILNHDNETIKGQNTNNVLTKYISEKRTISEVFPKEKSRIKHSLNELSSAFKKLNIRFSSLNETKKTWVLDIVYENNLYEINIDMLVQWAEIYSEEKLEYPSYSNVMKSSLQELKDYVNANLVDFLCDVLLKLKDKFGKWEEEEKWLIELLKKDASHENANIDKVSIINEIDFFEFNLSDYDESLWETIVSNKKLKCTWENLILYREKTGIDEFLLEIINNSEYINKLNKYSQDENQIFNHDNVKDFWIDILQYELEKESLITLKNKYQYFITSDIINNININKSNLKALINRRAFSPNYPIEVYGTIKAHFREYLIHLEFALEYVSEILQQDNTSKVFTSFNKEELLYVARNDFPKEFFVNAFNRNEDKDDMKFDNQEASDIIEKVKKFDFTENVDLHHHIFGCLKMNQQIDYFNWLYDQRIIKLENLKGYLVNFTGSLNHILLKGRKNKIAQNDINVKFADNLKKLGLINRYKIEKTGLISFYRNEFDGF